MCVERPTNFHPRVTVGNGVRRTYWNGDIEEGVSKANVNLYLSIYYIKSYTRMIQILYFV